MERKLSISCTKKTDFWDLVIIDQTHRCDTFGNPHDTFISSKGFTLVSCEYPVVYGGDDTLYVQGYDEDEDEATMRVSGSDLLKRIMHAVSEYNNHFIINDLPDIPGGKSFVIE